MSEPSHAEQKERDFEDWLASLPAKQLEPKDCTHPAFGAWCAVHRLEDTGRFLAELRVVCIRCREPFRFKGIPAGLAWEHPTASIDGLEANLPIEPELLKQLASSASYVMPPPPETKH
jgi:hypothetical protein